MRSETSAATIKDRSRMTWESDPLRITAPKASRELVRSAQNLLGHAPAPPDRSVSVLPRSRQAATASVEPLPEGSWVLPADAASRSSRRRGRPPRRSRWSTSRSTSRGPTCSTASSTSRCRSSADADPDGTLADAERHRPARGQPAAGLQRLFSARTSLAADWVGRRHLLLAAVLHPERPGRPAATHASTARRSKRCAITPKPPPDEPAGPPAQPTVHRASAGGHDPVVADLTPLTLASVRGAVRDTIRSRTQRRPRRLRTRCMLATP